MRDHQQITIQNINGLFDRGSPESVPVDHLTECSNLQFNDREVSTRFGTSLNFSSITNIRRIELYTRTGEATRLIILDSNGSFHDSSVLGSPILTVPDAVDFKMTVFFNRAYITPIAENGQGVPGSFIYVYDGTTCRKAAGAMPQGTLTASNSDLSGVVEAGFHLFAVSYETTSGFLTKPGPSVYALLNCPGNKKVQLSEIPTGPAGTIKRHILATRSILVYDGNQNGYEFFFVPGGTINDNSTTTHTVDFYDADLIKSAEYLFDQREELPAAAGIEQYKGRMIYWNENWIFVSKAGEPESFDALAGLILVNPGESSYIRNCTEFRDSLYIDKEYGSYMTQDNAGDPSTWPGPIYIDKSVGSSRRGTIRILNEQGTNTDKFLVCSRKGLVVFDGLYQVPELSYKIENVWKRINKTKFDLVHGCINTIRREIYIAVPLDSATNCSHILVANYSQGLDPVNVRWSIWSSSVWSPTSLVIDLESGIPYLRIGASAGIYDVTSSTKLDAGQAISSSLKTAYLATAPGSLTHFGQVNLRVKGSGLLIMTLYSEDDVQSQNLHSVSLSASPGKEYRVLSNFINEKAALKISQNLANDWFSLHRLDVYVREIWKSRPL